MLIAPLDWGLGHTTRCIPIIKELILGGVQVVIACNSMQRRVLEPECPEASFENFPGYGLRYGSNGFFTRLLLLAQVPKILISIKREKRLLNSILARLRPEIIISDNRYGFYSATIPSVFITHQLYIKTGAGAGIDRMINLITHQLISKFSICWIPDVNAALNLAGDLSGNKKAPDFHLRYIGPLSRLQPLPATTITPYILIVLSGPEPQRSILEAKLLGQLAQLQQSIKLVRGLPGLIAGHKTVKNINDVVHAQSYRELPFTRLASAPTIEVIDYAGSAVLNSLLCNASVLICRSGYTSIMDFVKLRKRAVVIPTPGQAEQEYLATHLHKTKLAVAADQDNLDLEASISEAVKLTIPAMKMDAYKEAIRDLLESLPQAKQPG